MEKQQENRCCATLKTLKTSIQPHLLFPFSPFWNIYYWFYLQDLLLIFTETRSVLAASHRVKNNM